MNLKYIKPALLFVACIFICSCIDKNEYEMELKFQRQETGKLLYENNRVLQRISKVIADEGNRPEEIIIREHATKIIQKRDTSINSVKSFIALVENIKMIGKPEILPNTSLELLEYYQKQLKNESDSVVFQKLINVYLSLENNMLMDDLAKVSGSCSWGMGYIAHVSKTTDTISKGQTYEIAVIPDTYDYRFSFVKDDCKIVVYKNDVAVDINYTILKKGAVYLITLNPPEPGNYQIRGSFTQSSRLREYSMLLAFADTFVVK